MNRVRIHALALVSRVKGSCATAPSFALRPDGPDIRYTQSVHGFRSSQSTAPRHIQPIAVVTPSSRSCLVPPRRSRCSVPVRLMRVGHMRVDVARRFVQVRVTMRAYGHRLVKVGVMPVVEGVPKIVPVGFVLVLVALRLGEVNHNPGQHQRTACRHRPTRRAIAERKGQ